LIEISHRQLQERPGVNDKYHIAHNSISMNIIVYRHPTHIYHSDFCPASLGEYSNSNFAWQYYLKPEHQFQATNNLLEHIAAIITPWVDIIWGHLHSGGCALSMTDSTTSKGWLCKTNFSKLKVDPIQAIVTGSSKDACHALHHPQNQRIQPVVSR
jgi:hypothetical protein